MAAYALYPYQERAVEQIVAAFDGGKRNVLLSAPTGGGKTYIARTLMDHYGGLFAGASLMLQDQFARDFAEVPLIQGHVNYCDDPDRHSGLQFECPEGCTRWDKEAGCEVPLMRSSTGMVWHLVRAHKWDARDPRLRKMCGYAVAKQLAVESPVANVNPWYLMREQMGPNDFGVRPLVIVDEADAMEGVADASYERQLSISRLKHYGWEPPVDIYATRDQVVAGLTEVLAEAGRRLRLAADTESALRVRRSGYRSFAESTPEDLVGPAEAAEYEQLSKRIEEHVVRQKVAEMDARDIEAFTAVAADPGNVTHWDAGYLKVRPVCPGTILKASFWPHAERRLLMSGSFTGDPMRWAVWFGLDPDQTAVITVPSMFAPERRTITVWRDGPVMSGRGFADEDKVRRMAEAIQGYRVAGRTLVHVSSDIQAQILAAHLPDAITYRSGAPGDKDRALTEYLRRPDGLIIGQSLRRGLDLKDDQCRANVVAKLPYQQLDRVTRARKGADGAYYSRIALSEVVQALGRAVRHEDDWAVNYILDASFAQAPGLERMLPGHVREAIVN